MVLTELAWKGWCKLQDTGRTNHAQGEQERQDHRKIWIQRPVVATVLVRPDRSHHTQSPRVLVWDYSQGRARRAAIPPWDFIKDITMNQYLQCYQQGGNGKDRERYRGWRDFVSPGLSTQCFPSVVYWSILQYLICCYGGTFEIYQFSQRSRTSQRGAPSCWKRPNFRFNKWCIDIPIWWLYPK